MVFDLTGDGRTVLKGNYGFFWHNPGVGVGSNANPNTPAKIEPPTTGTTSTATGAGSRASRATLAQRVARRRRRAAIRTSSSPTRTKRSVWLERQLADTLGVRAGFVYKTEDDLIDTGYQPLRGLRRLSPCRSPSSTSASTACAARPTTSNITMLGLPTSQAAQLPDDHDRDATPAQFSRAKTVELSMNSRYSNRWSASIGGAYTMLTRLPERLPHNPNNPGVEDRTTWNLKATGSYDAACGIRLSPVLRHQSGANYARTLTISCRPAERHVGLHRPATRPTPSRRMPTAKTTSGCSTCAPRRR